MRPGVWKRLDTRQPSALVVLKPDHVGHVDMFVRRYGARGFDPRLFSRDDVPEVELEWIEPGSRLPGGLVALYDGRERNETPCGCPNNVPWFSLMPDGTGKRSCGCGRHRGIGNGCCPHCA